MNQSTTLLPDRETCELTRGTMRRVLEFFKKETPEHLPSEEMIKALAAIPRTVGQIARGEAEPKFYVCPIATGVGKTVTLIHTVRLLREMDRYRDLGLVLCANRLEQIEALVEELKRWNDDLSVYVGSDKKNQKFHEMGLGLNNADDAPILITTHSMVLSRLRGRSWGDAREFFYKGFAREIRVWDEAMLPGQPIVLRVQQLQGILARTEWFPEITADLNYVVDEIRDLNDGDLFDLPDFANSAERNDLMDAVGRENYSIVELLLSLSNRTVRVREDDPRLGTAILDYNEALPEDIKPMLVTDASAAVRATYDHHDKYRKDLIMLPGRGLKKYRNVTFHVLNHGAGKSTFRKHYKDYLAAIGEVVNQAPGKVLVIHFKEFHRFRKDLAPFLSKEVREDEEKVSCLTWGRHDATNEYRECTTVILAGLQFYRKSDYEALGRAAAAKRAPEEYLKHEQEEITLGETRHHVLQAASRGSLRLCNGDQAKTCDVWLMSDPRKGLREELATIFPEAEVVDWKAEEHVKRAERKLSKKAEAVANVVREWADSDSEDPLYFTAVRQIVGETDRANFNKRVNSRSFQQFLDSINIYIRTVDNRKAFVKSQTGFEMLERHWNTLGAEYDKLEARLGELEDAGKYDGPEWIEIHARFMEVATQFGLAH